MRISKNNPLPIAIGILGVAVGILWTRSKLVGIDAPNLAPWAGQLILGYYLSIFVLAVRGLVRQFGSTRATLPEQTLLLLILAALTSDLVLNNVREAGSMKLDASYGPIVIWDTVTFFSWLKAIDLCERRESKRFKVSRIIAVAPILKVGREIMWMPFDGPKAYIDFVAGDLAISCWCLLWWLRHRTVLGHRDPAKAGIDALSVAVVLGCFYFSAAAVEELLYLAYRPLYDKWSHFLMAVGAPSYITNFTFLFGACAALIVILWRNPWRLAERLSLRL